MVWFITAQDRKALQRVSKTTESIIDVGEVRCLCGAQEILKENSHPDCGAASSLRFILNYFFFIIIYYLIFQLYSFALEYNYHFIAQSCPYYDKYIDPAP